jgi:hypothetical protein
LGREKRCGGVERRKRGMEVEKQQLRRKIEGKERALRQKKKKINKKSRLRWAWFHHDLHGTIIVLNSKGSTEVQQPTKNCTDQFKLILEELYQFE